MTDLLSDATPWRAEIDQRMEERREEDRHRHRTILTLVGLLIVIGSALISVTASWATSTSTLSSKVDKIDQIKVDAGFDARINVNALRIDGYQDQIHHLQTSVDSVNLRLTQVLCDRKPASCR